MVETEHYYYESCDQLFLYLNPLKQNLKSNFEYIKGTHTVYFSSLLYIINQKPNMIPKTPFYCITTCVARSSG